jgi:hypothetical protein
MRHAVFLAALAVAAPACADPARPAVTGRIEQTQFPSRLVGDTYLILARTPPDYDPARAYPIVFQLDATNYGNEFELTAGWASALEASGDIPPTIVVGVGYPYKNDLPSDRGRWRDYVTTLIDGRPGGAATFLRFLTEELLPAIDAKYHLDPALGRTLIGHSLGGYFTLYALFQTGADSDPPFQRFVAADGSLGDDGGGILDFEAALAPRTRSLPRVLSLDIARYDGAVQHLWFDLLRTQLQEHYPDLRLSARVLDEDHGGVMAPAFRDGLRYALGGAR